MGSPGGESSVQCSGQPGGDGREFDSLVSVQPHQKTGIAAARRAAFQVRRFGHDDEDPHGRKLSGKVRKR